MSEFPGGTGGMAQSWKRAWLMTTRPRVQLPVPLPFR